MFKDYIGETERNPKARILKHKRPSLTSFEVLCHIHNFGPGHRITLENVNILYEDIYIRNLKPALNKDCGRYQLSLIWDSLISDVNGSISLLKKFVVGRQKLLVCFQILCKILCVMVKSYKSSSTGLVCSN